MGQPSSTTKSKKPDLSRFYPGLTVLLTENANPHDETLPIPKRKYSEDRLFQAGPSKREINKAIKFAQDFLPLCAKQNETDIALNSSSMLMMNVEHQTESNKRAEEKVKDAIEKTHINSVLAKDLLKEQSGNPYKRFSFATQKEELLQDPNKLFKVSSFAKDQSTPDISKNLGENFYEQNNIPSYTLGQNAHKNMSSPPKVSRKVLLEGEDLEKENKLSNSSPKPKERNRLKEIEEELDSRKKSPQKNDEFIKIEYVNNMPDENQIMNLTNKQSMSFRGESKDQSKSSDVDPHFGFRGQSPEEERNPNQAFKNKTNNLDMAMQSSDLRTDMLKVNNYTQPPNSTSTRKKWDIGPQPYSYDSTQLHENKIKQKIENPSKIPLQSGYYQQNTNRQPQNQERHYYAEPQAEQQDYSSDEATKRNNLNQKASPSRKWPAMYSKNSSDKVTTKTKENSYSEQNKLKLQSKTQSDSISKKLSFQQEVPVIRKNLQKDSNIKQSQNIRKNVESLVQSSSVKPYNQAQKSGFEKTLPQKVDSKQPQPYRNYEPYTYGNRQQLFNQPRMLNNMGNLSDIQERETYANTNNYQPNTEMDPINVDLNLQELLQAANSGGSYNYPNHQNQNIYLNQGGNFAPTYSNPFHGRFQERSNFETQHLGPKHLDATANYEDNSQFERDNSLYMSKYDLSQDEINEHSMDYNLDRAHNNSYMKRNKYPGQVQKYVDGHNFDYRRNKAYE